MQAEEKIEGGKSEDLTNFSIFHPHLIGGSLSVSAHMNHLNPRFLCHPSQLLEKSLPEPLLMSRIRFNDNLKFVSFFSSLLCVASCSHNVIISKSKSSKSFYDTKRPLQIIYINEE